MVPPIWTLAGFWNSRTFPQCLTLAQELIIELVAHLCKQPEEYRAVIHSDRSSPLPGRDLESVMALGQLPS